MNDVQDKSFSREFVYNLPQSVLFHPELTLVQIQIYSIIRSFMDTTGVAFCSNNWLAKKTGVKRNAVIVAIKKLIALGFIKKKTKNQQRYLYININPILMEDGDLLDDNNDQGGIPEDTPPSIPPNTPPSIPPNTPPSIPTNTQLDQTDSRSKLTTTKADSEKEQIEITPKNSEVSSEFVIDEVTDKKLLQVKDNKNDHRSDDEFLKQCKFHLEESKKAGFTKEQALIGLKKIIIRGFSEPVGYSNAPADKNKHQSEFSDDEIKIINEVKHAKHWKQDLSIYFRTEEQLNHAQSVYNRYLETIKK